MPPLEVRSAHGSAPREPNKGGTVKKTLLTFLTIALTAVAASMNLEGGGVYWENEDTLLYINCDYQGILQIGGIAVGPTGGYELYVDGTQATSDTKIQTLPIDAGNHTLLLKLSIPMNYPECDLRLWAIFWPEKQNVVAERPNGPDDVPVSSVEGIRSRVARIGEVLATSDQACVYDAAGRLLDRPIGFWIPTEAGIYFLSGDVLQKVVVIE